MTGDLRTFQNESVVISPPDGQLIAGERMLRTIGSSVPRHQSGVHDTPLIIASTAHSCILLNDPRAFTYCTTLIVTGSLRTGSSNPSPSISTTSETLPCSADRNWS